MSELGRLNWLCRRGMKELDVLFNNYLEHIYPSAPADDQQAFQAILEMPDPELYDLILGRFKIDDEQIDRVIKILRELLTRA